MIHLEDCNVISRRTLLLVGLWALSIAIPVSYSKGRSFEGRRLNPEEYVKQDDFLNSSFIVFVRTLVGGEPESLRVIAGAGLLLTGVCLISLGFDFAPRKAQAEPAVTAPASDEPAPTITTESSDSSCRGDET